MLAAQNCITLGEVTGKKTFNQDLLRGEENMTVIREKDYDMEESPEARAIRPVSCPERIESSYELVEELAPVVRQLDGAFKDAGTRVAKKIVMAFGRSNGQIADALDLFQDEMLRFCEGKRLSSLRVLVASLNARRMEDYRERNNHSYGRTQDRV